MRVFQHVVAGDDIKGIWPKLHIDYIAGQNLAAGDLTRPVRCFCT